MVALALALVAAVLQDAIVGPPLPEIPASAAIQDPEPLKVLPALEKIQPLTETSSVPQKLVDRPESGPTLGGFLIGSFVVVVLMTGLFVLLKRFGRGSRFLAGGGVISVLARKPLGQRQEVFLVEVGPKVFLVGSTRENLTTLGEFSNPDEVASLRANLPDRKEDSMKLAFRESLREGIREEEKPEPAATRVYDSIAGELAEIRKTVKAWRA